MTYDLIADVKSTSTVQNTSQIRTKFIGRNTVHSTRYANPAKRINLVDVMLVIHCLCYYVLTPSYTGDIGTFSFFKGTVLLISCMADSSF